MDIDYPWFEDELKKLDEAAWMETKDMRAMVHKLVPEYNYKLEGTVVEKQDCCSRKNRIRRLMVLWKYLCFIHKVIKGNYKRYW